MKGRRVYGRRTPRTFRGHNADRALFSTRGKITPARQVVDGNGNQAVLGNGQGVDKVVTGQ